MDFDLTTTQTVLLVIALVWEMSWKGFALWKAAKNDEQGWFILLLVINSVGVLPILYLVLHKSNMATSNDV